MAVERSRRREFSEFVTDHLLGHQHRDMLLAVVDAERQPDELRQDGRAPAPDPDHLVATRRTRGFCLLEQIAVDERALPNRTRHDAVPRLLLFLPRVAAGNDEFGGVLLLAGLLALGRAAPGRHRMTAARATALAAAMVMVDRVHRHAAVVRHAAHP